MYASRERKRQRARKRRWLCILFILVCGLGVYNFLRPLPASTAKILQVTSEQNAVDIAWPSKGVAAIGAEDYGLLATNSQSQQKRPIASISKVITALVITDAKPLKLGEQGASHTITLEDVELYNSYFAKGGAVAKVDLGGKLTQYQALQAMLLPSANNVADSMAIWNFGSLDNYYKAANTYLARHGLTNTAVGGDASGFSPATVSTPADLIHIGELAMANPVIRAIVSQKSAEIPMAGIIQSANARLGYDNIIGIKTGLTDEAGGCFLFAAAHTLDSGQQVTVIGVILDQPTLIDAFRAAEPLLDSSEQYFTEISPVKKGEVFATYTTPWLSQAKLVAKQDVHIIAWKGVPLIPRFDLKPSTKLTHKGDEVGTLTMLSGTKASATPLVLDETPTSPSVLWRLTRVAR